MRNPANLEWDRAVSTTRKQLAASGESLANAQAIAERLLSERRRAQIVARIAQYRIAPKEI